MKIFLRTTVLGVTAAFLLSSVAQAVPIQASYVDTSDCDTQGPTTFDHELGDIAEGFPTDEAFDVTVQQTSQVVCVGDDGLPNDWQVEITNLSPFSYQDLFLVADEGIAVGNFDGLITDPVNAPAVSTTAFRIDDLGTNKNLIGGDNGNLIFEPGEAWTFLITNMIDVNNAGLSPPPFFGSIGLFSGSSNVLNDRSTLSIVANRVIPEPSSLVLAGLALVVGGGVIRPRRSVFV